MYAIEVYKTQHLGIDVSEVLRYMGVRPKDADENLHLLAEEAVENLTSRCRGAACYLRLPVLELANGVRLGTITMEGSSLKKHLHGCEEAYLFAATVGMDAERAITAAAKLSPARAVALDAAGSAAIEAFCGNLCSQLQACVERKLRSRFSPGYGDLSIQLQGEILQLLDAHRRIGLSVTAGGMLVPTKSVTAIVGIGGEE